eukprot:jgi/Mesvir1/8509/Mv09807-RA.1
MPPPPPSPSAPPPPPAKDLSITLKSESGDQVFAGDSVDLLVTVDGKHIEDSGDVLVTLDVGNSEPQSRRRRLLASNADSDDYGRGDSMAHSSYDNMDPCKGNGVGDCGDTHERQRRMILAAARDSCVMFVLTRAEPTQGKCADLDYDTCMVTCNLGTVVTGVKVFVFMELHSDTPGAMLQMGALARPEQSQILAQSGETLQGAQGEDIDYIVFHDFARPVIVPDYRELVLVDADGLNRTRKVWYGVKSPLRFYARFRTDMDCTLTPDAVDTFGTADVQSIERWDSRLGAQRNDSATGALAPVFEYKFEVAPHRDGLVWVQFRPGYCRDSQGHLNLQSSMSGMLFDGTPPVATVVPLHPAITSARLLTFTVQWSERVHNFSADGVAIANGALLSFNASGEAWGYYEVYVTPSGDDFVFFIIHEGAAMDAANNRNAEVGGVQVQCYTPSEEVGQATSIASAAIAASMAAGVAGGIAASASSAGGGGIGGLATMLGHIQLIQMMNGVDIPADPIVYESTNSMKWLSFVFPIPWFEKYNKKPAVASGSSAEAPSPPTSLRMRSLLEWTPRVSSGSTANTAASNTANVTIDCLATPLLCDLDHISAAAEEVRKSSRPAPDVTEYPELDDFQGLGDFLSVVFVCTLQVFGVMAAHFLAIRVWWALHRRWPDRFKDYPKFLMFPMLEIFAGMMVIPALARACAFLATYGGSRSEPVGILMLLALPGLFYLYMIYIICWKVLKRRACVYEVVAHGSAQRFLDIADGSENKDVVGEWKDLHARERKDAVAQYGLLFASYGGPMVCVDQMTDAEKGFAIHKGADASKPPPSPLLRRHSRRSRFGFGGVLRFLMGEGPREGDIHRDGGHFFEDGVRMFKEDYEDVDGADEGKRAWTSAKVMSAKVMGNLRASYTLVVFSKQLLMAVLSGLNVREKNHTLAGWCEMTALSAFLLMDLTYVFFVQPQPRRRDWMVALASAALEFGIVMCGLMLLVGDASRNKRYRSNVSHAMVGLMVAAILLQLSAQIVDVYKSIREWLDNRRASRATAAAHASPTAATKQALSLEAMLGAFAAAGKHRSAAPFTSRGWIGVSPEDLRRFNSLKTGGAAGAETPTAGPDTPGTRPETPGAGTGANHGTSDGLTRERGTPGGGHGGGGGIWGRFRNRYAPLLQWSPRASKRTPVEVLAGGGSGESPWGTEGPWQHDDDFRAEGGMGRGSALARALGAGPMDACSAGGAEENIQDEYIQGKYVQDECVQDEYVEGKVPGQSAGGGHGATASGTSAGGGTWRPGMSSKKGAAAAKGQTSNTGTWGHVGPGVHLQARGSLDVPSLVKKKAKKGPVPAAYTEDLMVTRRAASVSERPRRASISGPARTHTNTPAHEGGHHVGTAHAHLFERPDREIMIVPDREKFPDPADAYRRSPRLSLSSRMQAAGRTGPRASVSRAGASPAHGKSSRIMVALQAQHEAPQATRTHAHEAHVLTHTEHEAHSGPQARDLACSQIQEVEAATFGDCDTPLPAGASGGGGANARLSRSQPPQPLATATSGVRAVELAVRGPSMSVDMGGSGPGTPRAVSVSLLTEDLPRIGHPGSCAPAAGHRSSDAASHAPGASAAPAHAQGLLAHRRASAARPASGGEHQGAERGIHVVSPPRRHSMHADIPGSIPARTSLEIMEQGATPRRQTMHRVEAAAARSSLDHVTLVPTMHAGKVTTINVGPRAKKQTPGLTAPVTVTVVQSAGSSHRRVGGTTSLFEANLEGPQAPPSSSPMAPGSSPTRHAGARDAVPAAPSQASSVEPLHLPASVLAGAGHQATHAHLASHVLQHASQTPRVPADGPAPLWQMSRRSSMTPTLPTSSTPMPPALRDLFHEASSHPLPPPSPGSKNATKLRRHLVVPHPPVVPEHAGAGSPPGHGVLPMECSTLAATAASALPLSPRTPRGRRESASAVTQAHAGSSAYVQGAVGSGALAHGPSGMVQVAAAGGKSFTMGQLLHPGRDRRRSDASALVHPVTSGTGLDVTAGGQERKLSSAGGARGPRAYVKDEEPQGPTLKPKQGW